MGMGGGGGCFLKFCNKPTIYRRLRISDKTRLKKVDPTECVIVGGHAPQNYPFCM